MANQNTPGDILGSLQTPEQQAQNSMNKQQAEQTRLLRSIEQSIQQIIRDGNSMSQANAINNGYGGSYSYRNPKYSPMRSRTQSSSFGEEFDTDKIAQGLSSEIARSLIDSRGFKGIIRSVISNIAGPVRTGVTNSVYDLLDGIEHSFKVAAGKGDFSKRLGESLDKLAKDLGVERADIKKALGREIGKKLLGNSDAKAITDFWRDFKEKNLSEMESTYRLAMGENEPDMVKARKALEDAEKSLEEAKAAKNTTSNANKSPKGEMSREEVVSAAINAQTCNITTASVDINVSGVDLESLLAGGDVSEVLETMKQSETESQTASPSTPIAESEVTAPVTPTLMPEVTPPSIPSPTTEPLTPSVSPTPSTPVEPVMPSLESEFPGQTIPTRIPEMEVADPVAAAEERVKKAKQALEDLTSSKALQGVTDIGKSATDYFGKLMHSNSSTGKIYDSLIGDGKSIGGKLSNSISSAFESGKKNYTSELAKATTEGVLDPTKMSGMNGIISTLTGGATEAGAALSGITNVVSALGPEALLAVGAFKLVTGYLKKGFQPAIEGFKKTVSAAETALNRFHLSAIKNIENSQKRLMADINTLVETPFELLKKGAEEWYQAWDNNLRTITATQGYTKSDLQNLMASFADRLRQENLTSVVSAVDVTNSLAKVLESGLSGDIAEEFAYIATKLNAAVPTQDFFSYADTYASIAANAVRTGMSQTAAIEYANQQLTAFANNVLYASREVAGGFTTGLKNAESLFKQSVQIAQTGRTYNASEISGVLTAVSAITGAIAPDLATAMTDAIYKAAVGGNSTDILALRSLAGGNVSNTEFLQALTTNPQKVFTDLFNELAKRQNMSEDAYMEVAEGLSSIFGVSADSFARVDFAYLAQAIESMDTSSKALTENMLLLKSGETTTNAEQLKMQEINKQILDEGLSYVLDNEAARAIQQHMWDEQLARELQETEYGVSLHGAALELLEGIRSAVDVIATILNPVKLIGKIAGLFAAKEERQALEADISQVLELGKVGQGNALSKYNLITRNKNLELTTDLTDLLGGTSNYRSEHNNLESWNNSPIFNPLSTSLVSAYQNSVKDESDVKSTGNKAPTSKFKWSNIGKSQLQAILNTTGTDVELQGIEGIRKSNPSSTAENIATQNMQKMLDSMQEFVENSPESSYEEWVSTARKFGISDYEKAVSESGLTEDQISAQYALMQAQISAQREKERQAKEEKYWDNTEAALTNSDSYLGVVAKFATNAEKKLDDITKSAQTTASVAISMSNHTSEISTKTTEISTKATQIKDAIEKMQTAFPDMSTIENAVNGISNAVMNSNGRYDDNRADATGFEMSTNSWLKFIYNRMADHISPSIDQIVENTDNTVPTKDFNGASVLGLLKVIAAIMSNAGSDNSTKVDTGVVWDLPQSDSLRDLATGNLGWV